MRKEVLVAIILGVGLGLAVAFGIWRANLALAPKLGALQTEAPLASPEPDNFSELVITQPENNLVVTKDTTLIKGAATPRATVVVTTGIDEYILEADADGSFEKEIELKVGLNEIKVISFDDSGSESQKRLVVVYTTELGETE
ncbi:MAG: Uncharacterized protein G01um10145_558 [Microgenomates group bacterium Gr01-1014_5]|nr:MAG: Uncharacterized protein G01um10145_558 [Microgenomates group bacterium Gr01-1014_5]